MYHEGDAGLGVRVTSFPSPFLALAAIEGLPVIDTIPFLFFGARKIQNDM
jgi:hypothetical protein